ncbi:MAG: vitamin K epoxide reductase family protein, partial [Candidatus Spechtbacterales bacterium]|nr:vitamin K epoxide reductase family protein [Candidatus Spechtbacterales bacterium]
MTKQPYRVAIIVLALLGIAFMGYLSYLHYAPEKQAFCDLGEELSCSVVNKSRYAKVAGIPFSVSGVLYFIGVLYLALAKYNDKSLKLILFSAVAFLGPSLYLTAVELFILESLCIFCEGTKVLMIALAGIAWKELGTEKFPLKNIMGALVVAVLLAGIIFLIHSSAGPGDKYDEFAQCLT